jgi:hypothetical protein
MKIPSKIAPGEDGYRGPVLFNPGSRFQPPYFILVMTAGQAGRVDLE